MIQRPRQALTWVAKIGTVGLLLALLAGMVGRWAWPLELFANFRVQYAVLFVICGSMLLTQRQIRWALVAAAGAAFTTVSIFNHIGWPASAAQASEQRPAFHLIIFNVWFRNRDLRPAARYLEQSDADAVILLELERSRALELQRLLPSYRFAQLGADLHGAVIFSRWPLTEQRFEPLCAGCVSIAHVRLDWHDQSVTLLGAHLHWPLGAVAAHLRTRELRALAKMARAQSGITLLGGDFNLTPWSSYFSDFVAGSGLVDCAQQHGWQPTWPSAVRLVGIRIDQCFASPQWRTLAVNVGPDLGSDHLPHEVTLSLLDDASTAP